MPAKKKITKTSAPAAKKAVAKKCKGSACKMTKEEKAFADRWKKIIESGVFDDCPKKLLDGAPAKKKKSPAKARAPAAKKKKSPAKRNKEESESESESESDDESCSDSCSSSDESDSDCAPPVRRKVVGGDFVITNKKALMGYNKTSADNIYLDIFGKKGGRPSHSECIKALMGAELRMSHILQEEKTPKKIRESLLEMVEKATGENCEDMTDEELIDFLRKK